MIVTTLLFLKYVISVLPTSANDTNEFQDKEIHISEEENELREFLLSSYALFFANLLNLKSATIIQYTIKGRFMSR